MKTNKTFAYGNLNRARSAKVPLLILTVIIALAFIACPDDKPPENQPLNVTVSFVPMVADVTIDFSPSSPLPTGVTYILKDDSIPQNSWSSINGFNGQVTAADHYVNANRNVTFTQTFYLNGVEITGTGSKRTVIAEANTAFVTSFIGVNDSGSVTLKWPTE